MGQVYHIKEGLVLILVNVQWAHDQLCKAIQGLLKRECYGMQSKYGYLPGVTCWI